jgi:transketolase
MATALKMDHKHNHIYLIMSDGEQQEGQTWEAVMFAGKNKLNNITAIMDRNNIQIDGYTEDIMPLENLKAKYEAFGWHVLEVDGHNVQAIIDACLEAKAIYEKPTIIIAHTIAGKGVDFMEGDYKWHGMPPNKEQAKIALDELRTLRGKIQSEHQ